MEQEKLFKEKEKYQGYKAESEASTFRVIIKENGSYKLDANVSVVTIAVEQSDVNEDNVHDWLWELGLKFLNEHKVKYAKLLITSSMVANRELIVPWEAIIKEQEK